MSDDEDEDNDDDDKGKIVNQTIVVEISDNPIEIDITVDPKFTAMKYELTSNGEIDPFDAAYCLWLIIVNFCDKFGITPQELLANYAKDLAHDGNQTKH